MNISLTPQLEDMVKEKVASGFYGSASEVMREALRLLEGRDYLRGEIQKGIDSGPAAPMDFKAFRKRNRKWLAGQQKKARTKKHEKTRH